MKIMIVSDTHKQHANLFEALRRVGKIDLFIHLGDVEGYEEYITQALDCPVEIVAGNNDFFSSLPKEKEIEIGKYKVLLTHGHFYYATLETGSIKKEARARGSDIVMFGHTHRPLIDIDEGITALNPGSISYPRQDGRKPSYLIMELDSRGEAHYTINYIEK